MEVGEAALIHADVLSFRQRWLGFGCFERANPLGTGSFSSVVFTSAPEVTQRRWREVNRDFPYWESSGS